MSARSVSAKMAKMAASGSEESSMLDMVLMGAGVVVIVCLLVYIYNRFIHKKPTKNEYFSYGDTRCDCCACSNNSGKCEKCPYGFKEGTTVCAGRMESINQGNNVREQCNCCECGNNNNKDGSKTCAKCPWGLKKDGVTCATYHERTN